MYSDNTDVSRYLKLIGVVDNYSSNKPKNRSKKSQSKKFNFSLDTSDDIINISLNDTQIENEMKDKISKDPFKVEVRIQRVISPDCIYVAQTEYEKSNQKMISEMQNFYNNYCSESRDNWSEDALCTVYSAKDKSYFRAKILKIKSPTEVLVYFYDMGIEEMVTMNDIQVLHPKFIQEMTFCFKVKLAGILPCGGSSTWPSLSCSTLSEIIQDNANCKFYITKPVQEEICDDKIPVELWVRQSKIPGPLAPTKIEINSINRMLVDCGVALPIKNYFAKADAILAAEFKQQLKTNRCFVPSEEEVKWLSKRLNENDIDNMSHEDDELLCNSSFDVVTTSNFQTKPQIKDECTVKNWLPPTEIAEEVFIAIPTYVDNKCMVYLHSKKYNADILQYIENELQSHYKKVKINKKKQWKEGDLCIAQYHGNKKWYRGRVVNNLGISVQVEFVDYGNVEECEIENITDNIRLGHIPIQCTKCIVSGLKSASNKWLINDLDRIHALLVDHECKVSILQRQSTHLIVSITLFRPWKCDFLLYLANHMNMNIKIERKKWNDSDNFSEDEDTEFLNSTRDVVVEEITSDCEKLDVAATFNKSSLDATLQDVTLNEDIDDNLEESLKEELFDKSETKLMSDTENNSSIDSLDERLISSTPTLLDEDCFMSYKQLTIPQETKYIELILCCNKDPITSFAQLAENKDDMFSNEFHEYYLRYKSIMEELQSDTRHQPLIETFTKNMPCIAKFIDDMWYRCIITNSEIIPNSQYIQISLYYVDYGNHEYRKLDLLSKNHELYVPKIEWLELPAIAIKCTFWGIDFVSDDINLLASKLDEIYNQAVVAQIKKIHNGNHLVVEIYKDKTCQELFYAHLIEEGLYQFKKCIED